MSTVRALVSSMAIRGRRRAVSPCFRDGFSASLHLFSPGAFVCIADSAVALAVGSGECGGLAFEFAKDGFFMVEEIADEPVGVAVFEGKGVFGTRTEDARCEGMGEAGDVFFVGGGEIDEASEMGRDGVEGGNIIEPQLAEGGL